VRRVGRTSRSTDGGGPQGAGLIPGRCTAKVHQKATLGFTGRRALLSLQWSTKTLADIRADKRNWVRAILAGAVDGEDQAEALRSPDPADGPRRYVFEIAKPGSPGVPPIEHRILRAIHQRIRWREQLGAARRLASGPPGILVASSHTRVEVAA
jgi:hypothetical protein